MPLGAWRNNKHLTFVRWLIAGIGDSEVKEEPTNGKQKTKIDALSHSDYPESDKQRRFRL